MNAMQRLAPARKPEAAGICRRCADQGPTCCVLVPGEEETCFPVSDIERHRIGEHVGLDRGAFSLESNSGAFRAGLYRLFPQERPAVDRLFRPAASMPA